MSYRLEIAFNLKHTGCISKLKNEVLLTAENYGCEHSYVDIEYCGHRRITTRNHVVIILYFPEHPKHIINLSRNGLRRFYKKKQLVENICAGTDEAETLNNKYRGNIAWLFLNIVLNCFFV